MLSVLRFIRDRFTLVALYRGKVQRLRAEVRRLRSELIAAHQLATGLAEQCAARSYDPRAEYDRLYTSAPDSQAQAATARQTATPDKNTAPASYPDAALADAIDLSPVVLDCLAAVDVAVSCDV